MKKIYIFFILSVFVFFAGYVYADIDDTAASVLVDMGISEYESGNIQGAVHEFSKALMVSPSNKDAIEWLNKLGFSRGLYSGNNTGMKRVVELGKKVHKYKTYIRNSEMQNVAIKDEINRLNTEKNTLMYINYERATELYHLRQEVSKLKRENLRGQRIEKNKDYFTNQDELSLGQKYKTVLDQAFEYEKQMQDLEEKYSHLRDRAKYQYAHQDKLIHVLEDYLNIREDDLNNLEDRLLIKELSLTRSINRLLTTLDEFVEAHNSIDQYSSNIGYDKSYVKKFQKIASVKSQLNYLSAHLMQQNGSVLQRKNKLDEIEQKVNNAGMKIALLTGSVIN